MENISNKSGNRSNSPKICLFIVMTLLVQTVNAFTLPAWSDIFSSLKPVRPIGSNLDDVRWNEVLDKNEDFDELNLMEEGEARYGLVQLGVGTGTSYNVTLNLTGHILLAIGIATSLLAYMFLNDMGQEESYNSGGYNAPSSGYGDRYGRYRSHHYVKKRALDDEEKAVVEMLYQILSSLSEEQIEDVLKQFEKEVFKQATENQEVFTANGLGEDCVERFLCQLFVSDSSMELSRASRKTRIMHLLQEALNETDRSNNVNNIPPEHQSVLPSSSYSIYEWNDLVQIILGARKPLHNKLEDHLFLTQKDNNSQNGDLTDMLKDLYTQFNPIPSKVTEYLTVQDFSVRLKRNHTSASTSSLKEFCSNRYSKCSIASLF